MSGKEGPHLGAKSLIFATEGEVHDRIYPCVVAHRGAPISDVLPCTRRAASVKAFI
jgi:hypothetical protein